MSKKWIMGGLLVALSLTLIFAFPEISMAADDQASCTNEFPKADNSDGLLTQVVEYIQEVIQQATEELYTGIATNQKFVSALNAAFVLFVTVFGVMFMFGIVPLTLGQCVVRMIKMGIILAMVNEGFTFFDQYAIEFFNRGTDELIDGVIGIATGDPTPSKNAKGQPSPFKKLEPIVAKTISPQMMVTVVTSVGTGAMGPPMGGLLGMAMMAFIQTIVKALKVYCLSLVAKALLFGMAPIFVSFILFERTKQMFQGWLNMLVNFSLQPLLMFAFLSFYIILLDSAAENILKAEACWTEFQNVQGTSHSTAFWRFKTDGKIVPTDFTWEGAVACLKQGGGNCKDFPVSILDLLTFLILAHLAYRFADAVPDIAAEISASTLMLNQLQSGMASYFSKQDSGTKNAAASSIAAAFSGTTGVRSKGAG